MPTDNVPVVRAPANKKSKKKNPDKIPANIPAILSLPVSFFSLSNVLLSIIFALIGYHLYTIEGGGIFAYWFNSLNEKLPSLAERVPELTDWIPVLSELLIYLSTNLILFFSFYSFSLSIGFMSNSYQLTIASIVLNIIAKIKRKMNQKFPIISICFVVLAIVAALFATIILLVYIPPRIYFDLCRVLFY